MRIWVILAGLLLSACQHVSAPPQVVGEIRDLRTGQALSAQERALAREKWLYEHLLDELQAYIDPLTRLARALAALDALCALAERSLTLDWCAPQFVPEPCIEIEAGRHPVVQARLQEASSGAFIANAVAGRNAYIVEKYFSGVWITVVQHNRIDSDSRCIQWGQQAGNAFVFRHTAVGACQ